MDPVGAGRARGFRAPTGDEAAPQAEVEQPGRDEPEPPGQAEMLEVGRPTTPRRPAKPRALTGARGLTKRSAPTGWRWPLAAAGVLLIALVVIAALAFRLGSSSASTTDRAATTPSPTPATTTTPLPVTDLYQQVVPSVVLITTAKGSLGSGTVVTATGTVLTANHVVAGGGDISVVFADGTKAAATVASADPKTDTATLTPKKLPEVVVPAELGGGVAIGADVVAIGNPLGLRASTSSGIVSGLNRSSKTRAGAVSGLIQFDAAVNPGSSGGPLLNDQGLLIGVVVSIADPGNDEAFAGIGFAVPIGTALGGSGAGPGPGGGPQL